MRLRSFRVERFRSVVDSGSIRVDPQVTCLVGKNEAGKSALLEALYLFNPAYEGDAFSIAEQYPTWLKVPDRRAGDLEARTPITLDFELEDADVEAVENVLGAGCFTETTATVKKKYSGGRSWSLPMDTKTILATTLAAWPEWFTAELPSQPNLADVHDALGKQWDDEQQDGLADIRESLATRGLLPDQDGAWRAAAEVLEARLPRFFRFTEYEMVPGRVDLRELHNPADEEIGRGLRAVRALLDLAQAKLEQIGEDDYELRRGELEAVQIDLTRQVFEYWTQNPRLEVLIDVDKETVRANNGQSAVARYLDIRLKDQRTGYSNNFRQRSSGFQWFFSFLAGFSEFEQRGDDTIVLLDEPALTLHGKAQADFLRFINERLAPSAPVLYTTHSPFMVEPDRFDRVRLVEDRGPDEGSVATEGVLAQDRDSLFPLQAALGYDIAQNLFVGPNNLVVEGASEYVYFTELSRQCEDAGLDHLDPRWRLLPAGGAANIPIFVALIGPHLDVTVVADSDTRGMQKITGMISRDLLAAERFIRVDQALEAHGHADTEDLFTVGDYLKLYNATYDTSVKVADLGPGDRITKRLEALRGDKYDHGEVAVGLLQRSRPRKFSETTLRQFAQLFRLINETATG